MTFKHPNAHLQGEGELKILDRLLRRTSAITFITINRVLLGARLRVGGR